MKTKMKRCVLGLLATAALLVSCEEGGFDEPLDGDADQAAIDYECVRYVDATAEPNGDGLDWETAFTSVEEAVRDVERLAANDGEECAVLVKGDREQEEEKRIGDANRLSLPDGVSVYEGLKGTENGLDSVQLARISRAVSRADGDLSAASGRTEEPGAATTGGSPSPSYGADPETIPLPGEEDVPAIGTCAFEAGCSVDASGYGAVAMGENTTASGSYSVAIGNSAQAINPYGFAYGYQANSSGEEGIAIGYQAEASGDSSIALGPAVEANGPGSVAIGYAYSSGDFSVGMGQQVWATGNASFATGAGTTASGIASTAMGSGTVASGIVSTAMGYQTNAGGQYSTAIGRRITANGIGNIGVGLSSTAYTCAQDNSMCIMGGNVGIGEAAPDTLLHITNVPVTYVTPWTHQYDELTIEDSGYSIINVISSATGTSELDFSDVDARQIGAIKYFHNNDSLVTYVNSAARTKIESDGDYVVYERAIPDAHKGADLGYSGMAWDDLYYDDLFNQGANSWEDVDLWQWHLDNTPRAKTSRMSDYRKATGVVEMDPSNLPADMTNKPKLAYDRGELQRRIAVAGTPEEREQLRNQLEEAPDPGKMKPSDFAIATNEMVSANFIVINMLVKKMEALKSDLVTAVVGTMANLQSEVRALRAQNEELKALVCLDHPEASACRK